MSVKARTHRRPVGDRVGGLGDWPRGGWPLWARWNDELDQRYTLGVEEELMLLEPAGWSLAQASDDVLARLSDKLSPHTFPRHTPRSSSSLRASIQTLTGASQS